MTHCTEGKVFLYGYNYTLERTCKMKLPKLQHFPMVAQNDFKLRDASGSATKISCLLSVRIDIAAEITSIRTAAISGCQSAGFETTSGLAFPGHDIESPKYLWLSAFLQLSRELLLLAALCLLECLSSVAMQGHVRAQCNSYFDKVPRFVVLSLAMWLCVSSAICLKKMCF